MSKIQYFVRMIPMYDSFPEAEDALQEVKTSTGIKGLVVGYFIPQPKYKRWVPAWFIRLITN